MRDVARDAGVSVATVSRALNSVGPVLETTRGRVQAAAERLRYVPHGGARSLITRRTGAIGVLLPDLFGEFFSEAIRGIDRAARAAGYQLLVSSSHGDPDAVRSALRAMRGRVDGVVVMFPNVDGPTLRANLPEGGPMLLLNCATAGEAVDSINVDNEGGAVRMVRHLLAQGHRRIAHLTGPSDNADACGRLRGYRRALREAGGAAEPLELPGDFTEESGYRAARAVLGKPRPSAVFAANDSMAIGLLSAFQEMGVAVPGDVAVGGFDDIPIARFTTPPLSSVSVPIADLGSRATERLLAALGRGPRHRPFHETLPTRLVVRRSTGGPPPDPIPVRHVIPRREKP